MRFHFKGWETRILSWASMFLVTALVPYFFRNFIANKHQGGRCGRLEGNSETVEDVNLIKLICESLSARMNTKNKLGRLEIIPKKYSFSLNKTLFHFRGENFRVYKYLCNHNKLSEI